MLKRSFLVKQITSKNCFCYLSDKVLKQLIFKNHIKLTRKDGTSIYLSLGPPVEHVGFEQIGINRLYCKALGLNEYEHVIVSEIPRLPMIASVCVSPLTVSDYEILELLANDIQSNLLSQIRVVNRGQKFVVWEGHISLVVHVDDASPLSPGYLCNLTEVVIKQPDNVVSKDTRSSVAKKSPKVSESKGLQQINNVAKQVDIFEPYLFKKSNIVFRVVPLSNLISWQELQNNDLFNNDLLLFTVFIFRRSLPNQWLNISSSKNVPVCALKLLRASDVFSQNTIYVKIWIIDDLINLNDSEIIFDENIYINDNLFNSLDCVLGERLALQHVNYENFPTVKEIKIHALQSSVISVQDKFRKSLAEICETCSLVLNPDIPMSIGDGTVCSLKFLPEEAKMCVVTQDFLRDCKFSFEDKVVFLNRTGKKLDDGNFIDEISNYSDILNESILCFHTKMKFRCHRQNLLIIGNPGTGKSALLKIISNKLTELPYFPYVHTVSCKTIKGKTLESLDKLFQTTFKNLINQQPSVLLLDDLHVLCECTNTGDVLAQNSLYFNRISEMLHNLFHGYTSSNYISIISTTESLHKLNSNIYQSRGSHLFQGVCKINNLNTKDKVALVEFLFSKYKTDNLNIEAVVSKTEGFVMQDFVDFVDKAAFEYLRSVTESGGDEKDIVINQDCCDKALKNTVVLSLDSVALHSPGTRDFTDIGGLSNVKKMLIESLLWPAQYPNIFARAPLRLQSGMLLYGPPGTGKTILAGAAAKHCGLRLISVKGPELLSKYIGASEQSVREVFEKAQSAKPCILFFDEFDSLAPRRGHDNTGVTDRVVNQLLTQLDGIESLTGVCVLAATSRPDLLDPALLRPGRLDKQVKCPLPDCDARLEILTALSKSMQLNSDVDLKKIASNTDGFSGADLQSVLYTAQLSSVEHLLTSDNKDSPNRPKKITQKQLEQALKKTRPSLTKQEKLKYEMIYKKFEGGSSTPDFSVGTKATLA